MYDKFFIQQLKQHGYKITPQRRAIIEALAEAPLAPKASEIWEKIRQKYPDISLDTVYRNLTLLVDLGMVQQIYLRGKETSRFEVNIPHHHHLICLKCGCYYCLEGCLVNEQNLKTAKQRGFTVIGHALELYGYCLTCKEVRKEGLKDEEFLRNYHD
jgi:Fe2+ or Zn2+ uptake regulation protein